MTVRLAKSLALAMSLAAIGSVAWFGWQWRRLESDLRPARRGGEAAHRDPGDLAASDVDDSRHRWRPPHAQSRGPEWIYEVFNPPAISLAADGGFFVRPPEISDVPSDRREPSSLRLVGVRPIPFRLQFLGYVGGGGRFVGSFENVETGDVFLAGRGVGIDSLGLVIEQLEGSAARVRDLATGERVTLRAGTWSQTGEYAALVVETVGEDEQLQEVRAGDRVMDGEDAYVVDEIEPTRVWLERGRDGEAVELPLVPGRERGRDRQF